MNDIRQATAERVPLITGEEAPAGTLVAQLRRLLNLASRDADPQLHTLRGVGGFLKSAVARIDELMDPAPRAAVKGACVACGESNAYLREDGMSWGGDVVVTGMVLYGAPKEGVIELEVELSARRAYS